MTSDAEMTATDIARLAGVGRAAVSNWRRRYANFPEPHGGSRGSPTFKRDEVEQWLLGNGRLEPLGSSPAAESPSMTKSPVALALAALLPPLTSGVIIDPALTDVAVLAAAASRFGPALTYVAECFSASDAVAAERAFAGGDCNAQAVVGNPFDDLLDGHLAGADAVISIPISSSSVGIDDAFHDRWEFGVPAKGDVPLAWVQTAYSYLKPGAVAVLGIPFGAASRATGRRIRAELLRAGVLTHVIAFAEDAGLPSQVWLLRRPVGDASYTLRMVDLTSHDPAELPRDPDGWQAVFEDTALTRDVPTIELLDENVLLIPSAHITRLPRNVEPEYRDLSSQFAELLTAIGKRKPPVLGSAAPSDLPTVAIADLQRVGALEIRDRHDVEPGDVMIPSGSSRFDNISVATRADEAPRAALVVRCDRSQVDPYFLACFLRSEVNRRQAMGVQSGSFRLDLRRARVPRIPLAEQRRFGAVFRELANFAARADQLAAVAQDVVHTAVYGLTSGVLKASADSGDTGDSWD